MTIAGVVAIIVIIYILSKYNIFIKLQNGIKKSRSEIGIYLNQRFDLIPNIVDCVKGYSEYEKGVLESVTKMRTEYINGNKNMKKAEKLNNSVNSIMAVAENYPELKSSEQFLNLQKNLEKIESQLQSAIRVYNYDVTNYNTAIKSIPANIVASIFRFKEEELFKVEEYKIKNIDISEEL